MTRRVLGCAFVLASVAGCGDSFCNDEKSAYDHVLAEKLAQCPVTRQLFGANEKTGQACSDALDPCDAQDQRLLRSVISCFDGLPACVSDSDGSPSSFAWAAAACESELSLLSQGCADRWNPDPFCVEEAGALSGVSAKVTACPTVASSLSSSALLGQACLDAYAQCPSLADRILLGQMLACFAALPTCQSDSDSAFVTAIAGCQASLAGLSTGCRQMWAPDPVCAQATGTFAGLAARMGSCPTVAKSLAGKAKIGQACLDADALCTSADATLLVGFLDCLGKVAACQSDTDLAFVGAVTGCQAHLAGLSAPCQAAWSSN